MDYKEQLRHPKWQKKRLEIMNRDQFQCQCCMDKEDTLTVHHKKYIKGRKAWEYPSNLLITLCEDCHKYIHSNQKDKKPVLYEYIKNEITYTDYYIIGKRITDILNQQGCCTGFNTINELLLSQVIKKEQI